MISQRQLRSGRILSTADLSRVLPLVTPARGLWRSFTVCLVPPLQLSDVFPRKSLAPVWKMGSYQYMHLLGMATCCILHARKTGRKNFHLPVILSYSFWNKINKRFLSEVATGYRAASSWTCFKLNYELLLFKIFEIWKFFEGPSISWETTEIVNFKCIVMKNKSVLSYLFPLLENYILSCESVNASLILLTVVGYFITILRHQMSSYSIDL